MTGRFFYKRKDSIVGRIVTACCLSVMILALVQTGCRQAENKKSGQADDRALHRFYPYDPSAPERMTPVETGVEEWRPADIEQEIRARVEIEKQRREIGVYYYRIGYTLAFPLPIAASPQMADLPIGIAGIVYPWHTWLSWVLEERWRLLQCAWQRFGDDQAGALLQSELAALDGWDSYCEIPGGFSLSSAHLSACLANALVCRDGWEEENYNKAHSAAARIYRQEALPWFEREFGTDRELNSGDLQNIRMIGLARTAQLGRVIDGPAVEAIEERTREALRLWFRLRSGESGYTEANAYDGFFLDSMTEWLGGLPDRDALLDQGGDALLELAGQWMALSLPGRLDVQAPLGDTEPEMPFWTTVLLRLAAWRGCSDSAWFVRRLPLQSVSAAFLTAALEAAPALAGDGRPPAGGAAEFPHAIALRTGWEDADLLAAVGLPRATTGHLHDDAGQLVLGWQGRFWITDPGYQQYRPGSEQDFSIGPAAHNAPVIGGKAQTRRAPRLTAPGEESGKLERAVIDLTGCYAGLPAGAFVEREVRLCRDPGPVVIVRDRFENIGEVEVQNFWHGGTGLAWAFRKGWARLSDGERSLWIGVYPGEISAAELDLHEGSRGPLTLRYSAPVPCGSGDRFWAFVCDDSGGWDPPAQVVMRAIQNWEQETDEL